MAQSPPVPNPVRDLASRIYVDLAVRAANVTATSVTMQAPPENLARLSFKLAAAFDGVERELAAVKQSKGEEFKLDDTAMASWTK